MLLSKLLTSSGLSQPLWLPEGTGTDTTQTTTEPPPSGGAAAASATPSAGAGEDATAVAPPPAAGQDTTSAGEPTRPDWRERRIQELSGMNGKLKQRQMELEQRLAQLEARQTPAGQQQGRTYTPQEFEAAVQEQAKSLSAVELFDQKCNNTAREGMAKYNDFQDKLNTLKAATAIDPVFLEQAWEIGNAHDIIYELGKDPAKGMEIMSMRPTQRAVALAKMTNEIASRPKPAAVSKAPPPNPAAVGTQQAGAQPLENIQSMDDWIKERNKQIEARQAAGRRR